MSRYWRVVAAYPVLVRADEANGFCKANDHSCGRAMDTLFDAAQRDDATGLETTGSICNSCFCRHIQTFTDFGYKFWPILKLCVYALRILSILSLLSNLGLARSSQAATMRATYSFAQEWLRWMESHPVPALESAVEATLLRWRNDLDPPRCYL